MSRSNYNKYLILYFIMHLNNILSSTIVSEVFKHFKQFFSIRFIVLNVLCIFTIINFFYILSTTILFWIKEYKNNYTVVQNLYYSNFIILIYNIHNREKYLIQKFFYLKISEYLSELIRNFAIFCNFFLHFFTP